MADWLKLFVLAPHIRVLAINEIPGGGDAPKVRLEANVFGHRVEKTFDFSSRAEADYGFAQLDDVAVAYWLEGEGAAREADHARCL